MMYRLDRIYRMVMYRKEKQLFRICDRFLPKVPVTIDTYSFSTNKKKNWIFPATKWIKCKFYQSQTFNISIDHFPFSRNDLDGRTFKTFDFYKKHQDVITPAGLSFFQSTWERSLTDFYHNVLGMQLTMSLLSITKRFPHCIPLTFQIFKSRGMYTISINRIFVMRLGSHCDSRSISIWISTGIRKR